MKSSSIKFSFFHSIPVIVLYISIVFVAVYFFNAKEIINKASVISLNRIKPTSFNYLIAYKDGQEDKNKYRLESYRHYYDYVTRYIDNKPDAYGLLGYTSFQLGKRNKAIKAYTTAVKLNGSFFWYHYNLGVIKFKEGDYQGALKHFQDAVDKEPIRTLLFISKSDRLYLPIYLKKLKENEYFFRQQIKTGYAQSYEMILICYDRLKQYEMMFNIAKELSENSRMESDIFDYYTAIAALKLKAVDVAVVYLQKYIQKNKNDSRAFENLGLTLKLLGDEEKATKAIQNSVILKQTFGEPLSLDQYIDLQLF
ncbi:MAG: tetratricopeptide repeat protein [Candidatus Omnitrophica bacterium]|nr:tetratricopeptide repeat protein [Candidatus Omnitrophota bacterium]